MYFTGCAVGDIVREIRDSAGFSGSRNRSHGEPLSAQVVATIWSWLVTRSDVSVGPDRMYNDIPLNEILALIRNVSEGGSDPDGIPGANQGSTYAKLASSNASSFPTFSDAKRIFVSEDTMWETLTGHSVNYKRVPRSEWLLLLGIASTKDQGILQGDLGRLVDQDKRSVPKRTDSLVKKGYIVKRTTLVKGTKTSKLWLKLFAPPLPKETDDQAVEREAEMNLSRLVLAANLEPVPWHTRWTGESMDFHALATTIMATTKEWHVIRLQDLKTKLGVLGMRWQMKIVSKICRFLNSCGAIQYVAAKLENKLFKDCIRFNKYLSAKDWSAFLATGKRATKPIKTAFLGVADRAERDRHVDAIQVHGSHLERISPWSIDDPLPQKITKAAKSFGTIGLTNPEIYALTLGPTFNRYVSSMTASMATSTVQPSYLQHIQLKSEHIRVGKVASYRYYVPQLRSTRKPASTLEVRRDQSTSSTCMRWFDPLPSEPKFSSQNTTISNICGFFNRRRPTSGELKRRGRPKKSEPVDAPEQSGLDDSTIKVHSQPTLESNAGISYQNTNCFVTLHVSSRALRTALGQKSTSQDNQDSTPHVAKSQSVVKADNMMLSTVNKTGPDASSSRDDQGGRGNRRGSARGRGRGRPSHRTSNENTPSRPWICETCGGSWKNDIGLKYHLEKSRTPCNPQYTSGTQGLSRRGRKSSFFASQARESRSETRVRASSECSSPIRDLAEVEEDSSGQDSVVDKMTTVERHATNQPQLIDIPRISPSSNLARVKSWKRSSTTLGQTIKFTASKGNQGLLLQPTTSQPRQVPIFQNPNRHMKTSSAMIVQGVSKEELNITRPCSSVSTGVVPQAKQSPPVGIVLADNTASSLEAPHTGHRPDTLFVDNGSTTRTKSKTKGAKVKDNRARIRHFIEKLLRDQNGVLLGGKLLWDHMLASWNSEYPEAPTPKRDECQSALNCLLEEGLVMEHWHMFRDTTRSFSKCQLLTLPGVDAFSSESLQLLDTVKSVQAFKQSDGHVKIAEDSRLTDSKAGGRGRRLLASEVAVLHAPVYAAQVASKKEQGSETRERGGRRRLSGSKGVMEATGSGTSKKRKQIRCVRAVGESVTPTELPDFPLPQPKTSSEMIVRFLQPNTFLEQDALNAWASVPVHAEQPQPSSKENATKQIIPIAHTQTEELFSPLTTVTSQNGVWEYLDTQYFERVGGSFSVKGWMPNAIWFGWASFIQAIERRHASLGSTQGFVDENDAIHHQNFMRRIQACVEVEMSWGRIFEESGPGSAGPHNIWVHFQGQPTSLDAEYRNRLAWPKDGQLTQASQCSVYVEADYASSSPSDGENERPKETGTRNARIHYSDPRQSENMASRAKPVSLVTRALTPLPVSQHGTVSSDDVEPPEDYPFDGTDDLMAAFIVVRTLMGGADKAIDWGLLMIIFPNAKLTYLRRFWVDARKEQGPFIANFTRAFQERFIPAIEQNDIPMIDFDRPQDYDWAKLIRWSLQIPREEGFKIPSSRELFNSRFSVESTKPSGEDWRERFFHTQSSIFSRFEAVTAVPGVFAIDRGPGTSKDDPAELKEIGIARSWIKSLCSMGDGKHTVAEIRDKFFTLSPGNKEKTSALFKDAIELLTKQRVICKSKKTILGGRPYRLNEGYVTALNKMAQNSKYNEAAAFKLKMDTIFRKQGKMRIPYTFSDGAMMALTNLNASGRIKLVSTNLPNIPFGFEPGNYESRKYPKSYYHFGLEAIPAENYLYNDQIDVLRLACEKGPPVGHLSEELPQWVDFLGQPNKQRWSEILGAFCFTLATRGSMDTIGIRSALSPILTEFEVQLIVRWGSETGVLRDFSDGVGLTVGEWWWLTVPWLRQI
ncbi:B-block binding subunit of TFIIIC [Metarhizium album ARSEF 1941]|uniref:B-block binding subunit of TFIIIC n=1 Tax=Metarhizium album (strain ARSEF 1941) TaxID=1081103 RepID=A0A0B2WNA2_METAS|nr:B-block binding subunit of TFIIIC [Metarhizium album ARSEF 1941]KHN95423.1 B-block binding subunit of TFIIIC [Metarhizium album ARSEF 1941]